MGNVYLLYPEKFTLDNQEEEKLQAKDRGRGDQRGQEICDGLAIALRTYSTSIKDCVETSIVGCLDGWRGHRGETAHRDNRPMSKTSRELATRVYYSLTDAN